MRIYIIGMPGSGKTTVGRRLATALGYSFIDLDGMIEKEALMFVETIFETLGEEKFRELESDALDKIVGENLVISCGGGVVKNKKNKEKLKGMTFYLDTDLDLIEKRLKDDYARPLLKIHSLDFILNERYLKYQDFADAIVSNNVDVDETVKVIINYLKQGGRA